MVLAAARQTLPDKASAKAASSNRFRSAPASDTDWALMDIREQEAATAAGEPASMVRGGSRSTRA